MFDIKQFFEQIAKLGILYVEGEASDKIRCFCDTLLFIYKEH